MVKIRIFIAIDFDKSIKSYLQDIQNKLENHCIKGRFTDIENFHLTLQFIGELEESSIPALKKAMKECISKHTAFSLALDKPGIFKKRDSAILWIGIKPNEQLKTIYDDLSLTLKQQGIAFDEKSFKPHITLGRGIILKNEIIEFKNLLTPNNIIINVNDITLMESKQINGKLTYIPLSKFPLKDKIETFI